MNIIAWDQVNNVAVMPERAPTAGEWARFTEGGRVGFHQWHPEPVAPVLKNGYTGPEFYKALTVAERELLISKSKASDTAGAIFEQIKLLGLDFNDADDVAVIDKMVVAGILTQPRRDVLVG